jgi:ABC-2 type transport system ATP-binding protein
MGAVLSIKRVSKSFGKKKVVSDISFEVNSGEVFGFLGPNGAGKTTTIKMIMGFLKIDEGEVVVNGYNLKKHYEKAMAGIGGIVENPEMYNDLSGMMNLKMYARTHNGVSRARIDEVVEVVGMQNRINEKVKKYSLGMKQRVGLAQAILHRPGLLILDEPTNGLDPVGIKDLRDLLKRLAHDEGIAVFVSSHLLTEMELMCDRVAIINAGRLLGVKPIQELLDDATGTVSYRFNVKPVDAAVKLLGEKFWPLIHAHSSDYFDIAVEESSVPEIVSLMVAGGTQIYGINKIESSLEEAFIALTGGGNSIA